MPKFSITPAATICSLLASLSMLIGASAQAQSSNSAPINTGYLYNFKTSIDGGGDVSSQFFHVRGGVPLLLEEDRLIALSASYYLNAYDFSGGGPGSFAALNPWDNVHTVRLSLPIKWDLGNDWTFFGVPMIRFIGESGADFSDALSGGGIAGFSYRFNDRLTLGPGFGYITQIEDDASIFPVVFVDWKITESLSLSTGPAVGATLGPGLALNWKMTDQWDFSVGGRYQKLRFRLDEDSTASPGGVGEDRGIPVFGALSYQASENLRLAIIGGVSFGNKLKLEDSGGGSVEERNTDPSAFVGVNAAISF